MFKRILAVLLCVFMLASVLPFGVLADEQTDNEAEAARIRHEISRMYYRVLYATGRSSLHGFCGLMASYQLWLLGVNPYPIVYNGNDQYDAYEDMEYTLGGHRVKAYSGKEYSLEEALNTVSSNGTQNVYNILVGFQWTNTEAGQFYGHALIINAIIDGVVYFSEGYASEFNLNPGMPCVATIEHFAASYDAWTDFEGLVVFGRKDFTDFCYEYPSHLFVETTQDLQAFDIPSTADGEVVREVLAGERLEVTAVYENVDGEQFYRVADCGYVRYIPCENTQLVCFNYEDITAPDATVPTALGLNEDFYLGGHIYSEENRMNGIRLVVTDETGDVVLNTEIRKPGKEMTLGVWWINNQVHFQNLEAGAYVYSLYANVTNYYVGEDGLDAFNGDVCVLRSAFTVDTDADAQALLTGAESRFALDGWNYEDGLWRYYEQGQARTGWFCYKGIDYYLLEDGAAATGWHTVNDKPRYFTTTGAMRTGWLETDEGTYYLLFNGEAAKGERTIKGVKYTFDENGLLIAEETNEPVI